MISIALGVLGNAGLKPCVCCAGQPESEEYEELLYAKILVLRNLSVLLGGI